MSAKRLSLTAIMLMGLGMMGGAVRADMPPYPKRTCTLELMEKAGHKECELCWQSFDSGRENCDTKFPGATKVCEQRQGGGNNQIWCMAPSKEEAPTQRSGCEGAAASLLSLLMIPLLFRRTT